MLVDIVNARQFRNLPRVSATAPMSPFDDHLMEPRSARLMEPFGDQAMEPFRDHLMEPIQL